MTRIIHHNGQNPLPGSNTAPVIAAALVTLYAALTLTPDQLGYLLTLLGVMGAILGLAGAASKS